MVVRERKRESKNTRYLDVGRNVARGSINLVYTNKIPNVLNETINFLSAENVYGESKLTHDRKRFLVYRSLKPHGRKCIDACFVTVLAKPMMKSLRRKKKQKKNKNN